MKLCTGHSLNEKPICDSFKPEPSEISENGGTLFSDYCEECGHLEECHEELTKEQAKWLKESTRTG